MLKENLKTLLGTTFVYYMKAHGFHVNVEGPNFPQYHQFLGDLYGDVYGSIDSIAEYIRTLDSYSPGTLARMLELSVLHEQSQIPRAELMMQELCDDTKTYIDLLNQVFAAAEAENQQGIADFIAGRLDAMNKHCWMLRSILRKDRA